jgi:serine/threonine protein kinase
LNLCPQVVTIDRHTALDQAALDRFRREVDLQRKLSLHPNVVRFIGACLEYEIVHRQASVANMQQPCSDTHGPSSNPVTSAAGIGGGPAPMLAIVMELCRLGSLYNMVRQVSTALPLGSCRRASYLYVDGGRRV